MIEPNVISEQLENLRQYGDPDSIPKVRDAMFYSNISGIAPDKIFDYVDELNEEIHGSATSILKSPSDSTANVMGALTDNFLTIEDSDNVRHNIRVQGWKNYIKNLPPAKYGFIIGAMNLDPFSLGQYFLRELGKSIDDPEMKPMLQAVKEVQNEYKVTDWRKYPGLAGQIGKTMLEFAVLPEAKTMGAVARNFALQSALQAPSAQEEQMGLGVALAERAKGAAKAAAVGYGVAAAGKFIPNPFARIPVVTGGFMGLTALEGGTIDQILETGITILGFEAIGLIKNGKRREAIKAAKEYNPDLEKVPAKELESVIDEFDKVVLTEEKTEKPAQKVEKAPSVPVAGQTAETGAVEAGPGAEGKTWVIRGENISLGDDVRWMSGGTWDGKVQDVIEQPSGNHDVLVKATNGETFWLKHAEAYGINKGRSKFITSTNKPTYEGWEKDYPDLVQPAPAAEAVERLKVGQPTPLAAEAPVAERQAKTGVPPKPEEIKAEKPSKVGEVLYPEIKGEGEVKQRKMAQRLAEAIDDSLVKETAEGQLYQVSARTGETGRAAKAAKFVVEEPERAKQVAFVKEAPPEGVYPEDVAIAVYEKALTEGDFLTIRDLMNYRPEVETELGRRIEALKRNKPEEDLYTAMKEAKQTKEKEYTRRHKDKELKKTKKEISKTIKDEMRKATLALKDWTDFIEALRC